MPKVKVRVHPRPQFRGYLNRDQRWACIVAHRRAGKTVACIMDLVKRAIEHKKKNPRFAYIAPTYTQAKDVAWAYLKQYTAPIPGVQVSESELSVVLPKNGARIRLYGSDNYDRLRGLYLDGAILDESGDQDPRAWSEVVRPALSDRGGWATFIGTPKGRNEFYRIHQLAETDDDWFSAKLRASETGLLSSEELQDARKTMTAEAYEQEYECSFDAAVKGAYYGKDVAEAEKDGRIGKVAHDKNADVFAAWDLGIGDMMSIWIFQVVGQEWHFLRYYENNGFGLDHYVDWIKGLPFRVDLHFVPHDGAARELQSGKSRIEFLEGRGFEMGGSDENQCVLRHNVEDGINAVRMRFNRFWFDAEHCAKGIDCLRMYRSEFDEKNQTLKPRPLHDWASHGADAMRCAVMGAQDRKEEIPVTPRKLNWVV